jgi:hypothetical protein
MQMMAKLSRETVVSERMTAGRNSGAWRRWRSDCVKILLCWIALTVSASSQCPVSNPDDDLPPPLPTVTSSTRTGEPRIPESGYLSNTSYASTYFGFVIDLPIEVDGHRIMMPLMPPGQHALLALGFQEGRRSGTLLVTASEPPNPFHEMTEDERKAEFQAWAKGEPTRQIRPPDQLMRTGHWYHISKHAGDVTTIQYWTFIKNYLIRVKVSSNDASFLRKTKEAVSGVKFYCAQEDGTLINEDGKIVPTPGEGYLGPTIPSAVVDSALADKPALEFIDRGEIAKGVYRNEELGLVYTYPAMWDTDHEDPPPTAKDETAAQRAWDVLGACSLMLIRVFPEEERGKMITLRAVDQTCLGLPAPVSATDHFGAEELGAYLQMLGAFGEVRSSRTALQDDQLFALFEGVAAEHSKEEALGQRRAEAMTVTRHRKLLLVWSWFAPSPAELKAIPPTSATFEGRAPIELRAESIGKK